MFFLTKIIESDTQEPRMSRDILVQKIYELCEANGWDKFIPIQDYTDITQTNIFTADIQYGGLSSFRKAVADLYKIRHSGEAVPDSLIKKQKYKDTEIIFLWQQWRDKYKDEENTPAPKESSQYETECYLAVRLRNIRQGIATLVDGELELLTEIGISTEKTYTLTRKTPAEIIALWQEWREIHKDKEKIPAPRQKAENETERYLGNRLINIRQGIATLIDGELGLLSEMGISIEKTITIKKSSEIITLWQQWRDGHLGKEDIPNPRINSEDETEHYLGSRLGNIRRGQATLVDGELELLTEIGISTEKTYEQKTPAEIITLWQQWRDGHQDKEKIPAPRKKAENETERYLGARLSNIRQGTTTPIDGELELLTDMGISSEVTYSLQIRTSREKIDKLYKWWKSPNPFPPSDKADKNSKEYELAQDVDSIFLRGNSDFTKKELNEVFKIYKKINGRWIRFLHQDKTRREDNQWSPELLVDGKPFMYTLPFTDKRLMILFTKTYTGTYKVIDEGQSKYFKNIADTMIQLSLNQLKIYCEKYRHRSPSRAVDWATPQEKYLYAFYLWIRANRNIFLSAEQKKTLDKIEGYPTYMKWKSQNY